MELKTKAVSQMGLRVVPQTKALLRVDDDYYYYYHCDDYRARLERKLVLQAQKVLQTKSPLPPKATPLLYMYAKPLHAKPLLQARTLQAKPLPLQARPQKAKPLLHAKQTLQAKYTLQTKAWLQRKSQ